MMNRSALMNTGMKCLTEKLGLVDAERFIAYLLSDPSDYTEWRKEHLFPGMSLEEISKQAMEYYQEHQKSHQ